MLKVLSDSILDVALDFSSFFIGFREALDWGVERSATYTIYSENSEFNRTCPVLFPLTLNGFLRKSLVCFLVWLGFYSCVIYFR